MSGFNLFKVTIVQEEKQVCPKKSASAKKGWITREEREEREKRREQEESDSEDWEHLPKLFSHNKGGEEE